jgi:hypothetical protein
MRWPHLRLGHRALHGHQVLLRAGERESEERQGTACDGLTSASDTVPSTGTRCCSAQAKSRPRGTRKLRARTAATQ